MPAGVRPLLLMLLLPLAAGAEETRTVEAGALRLRIPGRWRERRLRGKGVEVNPGRTTEVVVDLRPHLR